MTDPLEQLREEIDFWRHRNLSPTAEEKVEVGVVVVKTGYLISRLSALEAVLAMHAADEHGWCNNCWDEIGSPVLFPCPTLRAIGKELGVEG